MNITVDTADHPDSEVEGFGGYPFPSGPKIGTGGTVMLYSDISPTVPGYSFASRGVGLAMHEFGHVLGLGHNPHPNSVMHSGLTREGIFIEPELMDQYVESGYRVGGGDGQGRLYAEDPTAPFITTFSAEDKQALQYVKELNECTAPGVSDRPAEAGSATTPTVNDGQGTTTPEVGVVLLTKKCQSAKNKLTKVKKMYKPGKKTLAAKKAVTKACS